MARKKHPKLQDFRALDNYPLYYEEYDGKQTKRRKPKRKGNREKGKRLDS